MILRVELARLAQKQLTKLPRHIIESLESWIEEVETVGLLEARKIRGYHDEPLQGERQGQRSIRLNKAYRAIYRVTQRQKIELVLIEEVNKHDY